MIKLLVFLVGFILGLLFNWILINIKKLYQRRSIKAKRKAFKKRMDDLMK